VGRLFPVSRSLPIDRVQAAVALSPIHGLAVVAVERRLVTDRLAGLPSAEASRRLGASGPNALPRAPPDTWPARLLRQLREPMAVLLLTAALVSSAGLGEVVDGIAIVTIVLLNVVIGMVQEGKAAQALAALQTLVTRSARVVRDGIVRTISSDELVSGDVVLLAAGDGVPADLRLAETTALSVDESLLTGESLPVDKRADVVVPAAAPVAERASMVFAGTLVTRGMARGIVTATGGATELGSIAATLGGREHETPIQRELRRLTLILGIGAVLVAAAVFAVLVGKATGEAAAVQRAFLVAVALAVAAVPEGLATVVTLGLARGVHRMARRGAIVRRLPAVETLGATTVILTDKTGTLTENKLRVEAASIGASALETPAPLAGAEGERVARVMVLCNDAALDPPSGDPLEVALLEAVSREAAGRLARAYPRSQSVPFDSESKRMSTLHTGGAGRLRLVKGAPEALLERCTKVIDGPAGDRPLEREEGRRLLELASTRAGEGMRMLALAEKVLGADESVDSAALTLVGLVGLRDPIRLEAAPTVAEARAAGIEVVMVTGDHAGTARWVAEATGIISAADRGTVLTGSALQNDGVPSDPLSVRVYARTTPEQKLLLVEALQAKGHVVAVTGDGVNDAPALRRADIGVAMGGRGTDVAREAADLVITDDNLATIVAAVREGRGIYDNIRKVVDYLVAGNLSEIMVVVGALALVPELAVPLLPLQLLWLNLMTDGLPALALGAEATDPEIMRRRPRAPKARIVTSHRLLVLGARGLLIAATALAALLIAHEAWGEPWEHARGSMFSVLVGAHIFYAFAVRRDDGARPLANRWLVGAAGFGLLMQLVILAWPPAQVLFDTAPLSVEEWALVLALGPVPFVLMAAGARLARLWRAR
jgi:calcium-translocating P-type ATPase